MGGGHRWGNHIYILFYFILFYFSFCLFFFQLVEYEARQTQYVKEIEAFKMEVGGLAAQLEAMEEILIDQ